MPTPTVPTPRLLLPILACLLLLAPACWADEPAPGQVAEAADAYASKVWSLVSEHCLKCHGGGEPKGELSLEKFATLADVEADRETWERVLDALAAGNMPPEEEPQPAMATLTAAVDFLRGHFAQLDAGAPADPGRVTIRRLNRQEYRNTIRDLVGIDFDTAADFPADDVGYGFDNIGDVLTLSPVLMEKYLSAAETILSQALSLADLNKPLVAHYEAEASEGVEGEGEPYREGRILGSHGEIRFALVAAAGDYALRIRAYGHQAGPESARMAVRLDGQELQAFDVNNTERKPGVYDLNLTLAEGAHQIGVAFLNDYYKPDDPDPKRRDRNLIVDWLELEGPLGKPRPIPDSYLRVMVAKPTDQLPAEEAARTILSQFATRAFRRPATPEEIERLLGLFRLAQQDGDDFERSVQLALEAVLVSPHFLFRVELDSESAQPGAAEAIGPFELASRLSYFLWSSMPDDELMQLAASGELLRDEVLEAQTRRLLAHPRSRALVDGFAAQWLQLRNLEVVSPDPKRFPDWDPDLRAAMRGETEQFFEHVMRDDRSVLDFLSSDYTFVNERLARHYGIEGVQGPQFRQVSVAGTPRGGVVAQGSVLTVTSNPTRTSPVKRGKWILEELLASPPPPPPPNVPELSENGPELKGTLRQRMEQHRSNAACASCHARLDPLGFGLENFDAIGAWRDQEGEAAIDAAGTLPGGESFAGPAELKTILRGKADQFRRCLTEKMLTYAIGRGMERTDRRAVDTICRNLADDGDRFSRLVLEIVRSEPFLQRRAKEPS